MNYLDSSKVCSLLRLHKLAFIVLLRLYKLYIIVKFYVFDKYWTYLFISTFTCRKEKKAYL